MKPNPAAVMKISMAGNRLLWHVKDNKLQVVNCIIIKDEAEAKNHPQFGITATAGLKVLCMQVTVCYKVLCWQFK